MESVSVYEPSTSNTENLASSRGRASFSGRRKHHRRQQANRPLSDDAGHDSLCDSSEVSGNLRGNHSSRRNFKRKPHNAGSTSRMPQANHGSSGATEDQPVADNCGEQAIVADQQSGVSQRGNHSMRRNSRRKPHNASSTNRHAQSDMATLALNPQNSNTNNQSRNPDLSRNGFMFNPNARPFLPSPQNQYRNKNKNSARSELQNDDKDITQPSSQRRISRNSATFRGASSVRRGGQRRINNNEDAQCLRESLTTQLENETYECMICFQTILCQQSIWSCKTCFRMFHISGGCITDWAKKSREDDHKWRCPMCQTKSEQIPYNYYCFCGKKRNPRMIVGEIPHSCGRICGGQRGVGCPHPCSEPCHPGPCPECPVMMTRKCCCGSTEKAIRCGTGFNVTCENKCGKTLSCGEHACEKTCHTGDCDRCEILVSYSCFCGDNTKEFVCDEAAVGKVGFSCEEDCSGLYKCGKHRCAKKCHTKALDCGPCPADPSRIISCPCGKCMQEELGPKRVNCSDPILTCASICNKVLPCGEQGKSHRCKSLCHNGPCPPCTMSTLVTCRCNSEKITLTCDKYLKILEGDGLFICERKCKKRKSCGHHRCQELCCTQTEHLCVQVCGKRLSCGLHHCENLCHPGQCQRCLNASFDEQFCHCGRTMRPPPVPCGTPLPVCDQPCARRHSCDHQVMHPCHSDQSCPPCAFLVDRPCYGKHEVRKNIPCYLDSVSCGRVCGLSLSCDVHNCARNCHSGDCSENGVKCTRPCPVLRRPCEHPCARPCHPGEGCPPSLCTHLVQIMCDCGRRKEMVKCCEAEKSMTLLRALRVNDHEENPGLLCDVSRNTLTRSSSMEQLSCLSCNDDCKKVARNKLLADALSIVTNDDGDTDSPTVTFTETLKAEFKSSSQFVAEVEAVFIALLDTLSDATNTNAMSHHFRPMPLEKRRFLHEYGQFFQIETQSFDSPPQRSVVVTAKRGVSKTPLILLSDLHKYPSVLKAPGKTVLRSNINDEIKKAADAKAKLEGEEGGLKTIKSDRKVIRRAAPRIEAAKPLSQSNAFSLLCSDAEEAADEQESITPITSPERPYSIPTQKDADWWSDEEVKHE